MKIIVTTSDNYHHLLPVFFKLYERHWGDPMELVGYKKPDNLPNYVTWVSLGEQRGPQYFTEDLCKYFEKQPYWFVWMMEDTFFKGIDKSRLTPFIYSGENDDLHIGKICLTRESMNRETEPFVKGWHKVSQTAKYRLSSQPAIWNRTFLVTSMMGRSLNPWEWETQDPMNDGWDILVPEINIVSHNEGVTKHDIHKLNLNGITL